MKKILICFLLLSFLPAIKVFSQYPVPVDGDYRSFNSGNWNVASNWEKYSSVGKKWVTSTTSPSVTGLAKTVTIMPGHTIDATSNITSSSTSANIIVSEGGTLNMNAFALRGSSVSSNFYALTIDGNLNTSALLNVFTLTIGTNGVFTTSYNGSYGWYYITTSPGSVKIDGTVNFNGAAQQIPSYLYSKILLTGTDKKTISNQVYVTDLTVDTNTSLEINGSITVFGTMNAHGLITAHPESYLDINNLNIYKINGFELQTDNSTSASLILSGNLNSDPSATGNTTVKIFIPGSAWHYLSLPFTTVSKNIFSSESVRNVSMYDESYITTNMENGWINYEGYHYNAMAVPPAWQLVTTKQWPDLTLGQGYNYYSTTDKNYSINQNINTSDAKVTLKYGTGGAGTATVQGFNLIGNPFTSGIDWNSVVNDPLNTDAVNWSMVEQAIYFRYNGDLIIYNNGVTLPNTYNEEGNLIPKFQGFFIKSNVNNFILTIGSGAKVHTTNLRYKGIREIPLLRLEIDNSVKTDQAVIRFDENATLNFDNNLDARKLFADASQPSLNSSLNGVYYSINGIPFPEHSFSLPIIYNAPSAGNYTIRSREIIGLENYRITLKDNLLNSSINLADVNSYNFASASGKFSDRFVLSFENITTDISENNLSDVPFKFYSSTDMLNVQVLNDSWTGLRSTVKIFDLTGRELLQLNNVDFSAGALKHFQFSSQKGVYLIEISAPAKRFVGKFIF